MTNLTLLTKASNPRQLKQVEDYLKGELGNLDLDIKILGNPVNRWVQVSLSGEDEAIATNFIKQQIGTCPISFKKIEKFSVLNGYITKVDGTEQELKVDIGVFEPKIIQAAVPLTCLQAQLVDGKKVDFKKISDSYGLQENLPVSIKITNVNIEETGVFEAELSPLQLERILSWQKSLLDRLIILGVSRVEVEQVINRTGLNRDIIDVEALGLFENALTCKLGTDAAGLIPKVGRYLRHATFIVFNPRRAGVLIGEMALNL